MDLADFVAQVSDFEALPPRDKICLFAWYLHAHGGVETFDNAAIRNCFSTLHLADPNVARDLPRMADKKPADLIRVRGGYKLEGSLRRSLDSRYGVSQSTVTVAKLLSDLPSKIPDLPERAFLSEAIDCYRVRAYRAAIIMTWNLAFDHLIRWIVTDHQRLTAFNAAIPSKYPKKHDLSLSKLEDFEDLKESETIEICRTAALVSKSTVEVLREKLKRRNSAAHPSQVVITQSQADDVITDLVNNVVLTLK